MDGLNPPLPLNRDVGPSVDGLGPRLAPNRRATEARSQRTKEWIRRHVKAECRYRPPRGGRTRKGLQREGRGVASWFFQLPFGQRRSARTWPKGPR